MSMPEEYVLYHAIWNNIGTGPRSLDNELGLILTEELGHKEWRSHQLEAIRSVVQGKDVFVVSPTGSGKSTVYQASSYLIIDPATFSVYI